MMDNDEDDENKLRLMLQQVFSFIEIDGMGKTRVWKDALLTQSI
jgi:hypothetical protein